MPDPCISFDFVNNVFQLHLGGLDRIDECWQTYVALGGIPLLGWWAKFS